MASDGPVVKVNVAGTAHDMKVGLILLIHNLGEPGQQLKRRFDIRFVRHGLGDDHDESSLGQFFGQQRVTVNGFTRIANEHQPGKGTVTGHVFVLSIKHGRVDHPHLRRKRAVKAKFRPSHWEISPNMTVFKRRLLLKQGQNRR